jgi:hypothetical protein
MPPSPLNDNIPIPSVSEIDLCLGKQFVDTPPVETDDNLIANDNSRGPAALVGAD